MTATPYPGDPLGAGQIRLIRLRPGKWTDTVTCDLYNTRQYNAQGELVHYYALSYVWGSRGVTRPIRLAGKTYQTTINLQRALRYVRMHHPSGAVLWVDALCIDQENVQERTHQVELMSRIYSRCQKVLVYLGDNLDDRRRNNRSPAPMRDGRGPCALSALTQTKDVVRYDASRAFALLQELSQGKHLQQLDVLNQIEAAIAPENLETNQYTASECLASEFDDTTCVFESLRRLMHHPFTPWWTRVWVIQESALAPSLDIIHGTTTVPWTLVVDAAKNLARHSSDCCSEALARLPQDQSKVLADFAKRVLDVADLRINMDPKPLLELLRRFRDRNASDPRDKVYALLSLASTQLVPDYSVSEVDVFMRATLECIQTSRSLDVLNTDLGRKFRTDLPSWVPDWSSGVVQTYDDRAKTLDLYEYWTNQAPMSLKDVQLSSDAKTSSHSLILSGLYVGRIHDLGDVMWGDAENTVRGTIEHWWFLCYQGLIPDEFSGVVNTHEQGAFWKLICADVMFESHSRLPRRTRPDDELTFALWAIVSAKSPFRQAERRFDAMWSADALAWQTVVLLWPDRPVFTDLDKATDKDLVPEKSAGDKQLPHRVSILVEYADAGLSVDEMLKPASYRTPPIAPWGTLLSIVMDRLSEKYLDADLSPISRMKLLPSVDRSILTATSSRRLFIAKDGYPSTNFYGLCPAEAICGDGVFALVGGKTPYILRPSRFLYTIGEIPITSAT